MINTVAKNIYTDKKDHKKYIYMEYLLLLIKAHNYFLLQLLKLQEFFRFRRGTI